jgi:predicted RNase H-like nuclease (RuvC/YqgF family)
VIAGYDPGTVSGLAVIDLRGQIIFATEFRGGKKQAVELLGKNFRPSIVASDKASMPGAEELAAAFNAIYFHPKADLSVSEKSAMTRPYGLKSPHERDALAAALFAFKHYRTTIEKVSKREQEILDGLLRREIANVSEALKEEEKEEKHEKKDVQLERRTEALQRRVEILQTLLEEKNKAIEEFSKQKPVQTGPKKIIVFSKEFLDEKKARERVERELLDAHSRLSAIEQNLKKINRAKPEEKEDIRTATLRMIEEYKGRFHK